MNKLIFIILIVSFAIFNLQELSYSQDEDCCEEDDKYGREEELSENEWRFQMESLKEKKNELELKLSNENKFLEELRNELSIKQIELEKSEEIFYTTLGMNRSELEDFRLKFSETEKKILNRTGTPSDARKSYFNMIESSKAKCLPEFYERYATMKQKLLQWEKDSEFAVKYNEYTVVKGDCLWKISGKKEIYDNPRYWPKIWDANKEGVISAPGNVEKKITNPNLIYPGQVLRIPALSDEDIKKLKTNTYLDINMKKIFLEKEHERQGVKKSKMRKKDIRKPGDIKKKDN